jgi:hypothetical protein
VHIAAAGKGGGLYLALTHVLEADVPWGNVIALIEEAEEYGECQAR